MVLSCFFVLQLVIGVLVDAINQKSGKALYTALQRNWVQMEIKLTALKPLAPLNIPKSQFRNKVSRQATQHHTGQRSLVLFERNKLDVPRAS